ncbi:DUF7824 domain-containing protein [Streptomyces sp. NPDC002530]
MSELLTAVNEGRLDDIPALLASLDKAERRSALAELKQLRTQARTWTWGERTRTRKAILIAGAGCHGGAAGCATWIGARDMREWVHSPYPRLLGVLADRDPDWLADLARRLSARSIESDAEFRLVAELVRMAGCPLPVSDGLVRGWSERVNATRWGHRRSRPLVDVLRDEPHLPELVPHLLEMPEVPTQVTWTNTHDPTDDWPASLAVLTKDGLLDRGPLLDRCVTRLLRGGKPADQRFCLRLLQGLEPTAEEERARISDWIAMASDGTSAVASHAQSVLTRLDAMGAVSVRQWAEVSGPVLFRPEKKLVRAQLVQLGKVLRRAPEAADELLPLVAEVFGHPDIALQEQSLKLVARRLSATKPAVREDIRDLAAQLGPVHQPAARALFGETRAETPPADAYEEILPSAPVARRLGPPVSGAAELVEEYVALSRTGAGEVTAFERVLDGLIRCAHDDRKSLSEALPTALAGHWWADPAIQLSQAETDRRFSRNHDGVQIVVAAFLGRVSDTAIDDGRSRWTATGSCCHAALDGVLYARLWEAAAAIRKSELPFLLATPTWHTGSLDPAELVERLTVYRDRGLTPGPADFGQALLRVRRTGEARAADAAAALGTREGDRLAAWIRADAPVAPVLRRAVEVEPRQERSWLQRSVVGTRRLLLATKERLVIQQEFPRTFHWLGRPHSPRQQRCYHWGDRSPHWIATLPEDADTLAAWLLPSLTDVEEQRGMAWPLPDLIETEGPAGRAVHLALAYGLGARFAEDRLSAVDALLVLAARGRLDAELLSGQLGDLIERESVKPARLADSARTAALTGACRTVLSVLVPVLPALLGREKAPRGLSDLLAVAAECAERSGPPQTGRIPGLAATAARGGSTQLVRQAARLEAACGEGAAASP